ncbi:MAG: putative Fe-S cluster assembly protein SufT [Candidatus Thermoplasmatota archaeon]|nr:putative Fe-S cluster assembly protein SufT [Candidatus Thermoplasmatota archaeon]
MFQSRNRNRSEWIELERDVTCIQIPDGDDVHLKEGQKVRVHQELGGSFTLMTEWGYLVRLSGADADALGREPSSAESQTDKDKPLEERVWDAMKQCYDPEIPINVVDLGLIYRCEIDQGDEGAVVDVDMTLTAPGCGMGDVIARDVKTALESLSGVAKAKVNIVFDPPWDRSMMSEAAMLELGFI